MNRTERQQTTQEHWPLGSRNRIGSSITFALLLLYLLAIPLKFQIEWLLVDVQFALLSVLVLRVFGRLRFVEFTRTQTWVIAILGLTLCVTVLGQLVAVQGENLTMIPQVSRFLVVALACVIELDSRRRINWTLAFVTAAAAVIGLLSVINTFVTLPFAFTGPVRTFGILPLEIPRSLGIWMSFGSYGLFAFTGLSYAGMTLWRPRALHGNLRWGAGYTRLLATSALVAILAGVYVGKSRSTLLALFALAMVGLVVASFHEDDRIRAVREAIPRAILSVVLAGFVFAAGSIKEVLIGSNTASVAGRFDQYQLAVELILRRPLLGWGWDGFTAAFPASYTVHNMWLYIGVSLGAPLLLCWIYLFVRLGRDVFRIGVRGAKQHRALGIVGTGMLVGGIVEIALYPGFTPSAAMLVGLLTAMVGLPRGVRDS